MINYQLGRMSRVADTELILKLHTSIPTLVQFQVYDELEAIQKILFKSSTRAGKFNGASIKILISCNA